MSRFVYFYSLISNLRLLIELLNVGIAFGDEDTLGRTIGTNKSVHFITICMSPYSKTKYKFRV